VLDEKGNPAFEGREWVDIVGASTYQVCARQVEEMIAWRKAGAWDHAILAIGGVTTVERARDLLNEGANAAMVDTAAIFDPLLAVRFRSVTAVAPAPAPKPAPSPQRKVAAR
jgi:phosphoribosylformimino-5-aminoimidazole carboxamide ribonucleotide (ProFAR) isomerase